MRRAVFALTLVVAMAAAAPSLADNSKLKVNPFVYDPGHTGIIVSAWQAKAGLADTMIPVWPRSYTNGFTLSLLLSASDGAAAAMEIGRAHV